MCQTGGPRCAAHARAQFNTAADEYQAALDTRSSAATVADARRRWLDARHEYESTPEGTETLRGRGDSDTAGLAAVERQVTVNADRGPARTITDVWADVYDVPRRDAAATVGRDAETGGPPLPEPAARKLLDLNRARAIHAGWDPNTGPDPFQERADTLGEQPMTASESSTLAVAPGQLATMARCPSCGQFAAADGAHTCPPRSALAKHLPAGDRGAQWRDLEPKARVDAMLTEVETGVNALTESGAWQEYLDTMGQFHRYSLNNQLLILTQRHDATLPASMTTWNALGRSVNKGEKGILILRPVVARSKTVDDAGNPILGDDGKPKTSSRCVGFATTYCFDVSQTSGQPLPTLTRPITDTPPPGLQADLETAIRKRGYTVSYEPIDGRAGGYTEPATKRVVVDAAGDADRARVLAHELGHIACGHPDRADEYRAHRSARSSMEVEADSVAYVVCRANGFRTGNDSFGYVAGWAGGDGRRVKEAAERVRGTCHTLLTEDTWTNSHDVMGAATRAGAAEAETRRAAKRSTGRRRSTRSKARR